MTYRILREELMKVEDEVRGRDLNHAWQCLQQVNFVSIFMPSSIVYINYYCIYIDVLTTSQ